MSTNINSNNNKAYGLRNPLQSLAPQPIISQRAPTSSDSAPLGTPWIWEPANANYILTSPGVWTAASVSSSTVATLDITGGVGTVLTVDAGGDTSLGGDLAVTGDTTMTGNLIVSGATGFTTLSFGGIDFLVGAGDPNGVETAAKGSLYTNTTAITTTTRLYINIDGATTWAHFTASA